LGKDLPASAVDSKADELVLEFQNPQFRKWYCQIIYALGLDKIDEIRAKVQDGDEPGRLFSHYANQEKNVLFNKWRLDQMRKQVDD
jgi:hypothetical protein